MFIELSKIQSSCDQEGYNPKISERAKATGFGLSRLNQRVQSFKKAVVNARLFPLHDAFPMSLDRAGGFNHGLHPAMCRPEVPFLKHGFKQFWRWSFVNLLKVFPDVKGFDGFQIHMRH